MGEERRDIETQRNESQILERVSYAEVFLDCTYPS